MAGQKIAGRHRTLAFRLNDQKVERSMAGCDEEPITSGLENGAGRVRPDCGDPGRRTMKDQPLSARERKGVRPRKERA